MKSLPTGLFLPGAPIYRMNPNVKLQAFFLLVTAIILTNSLWGYALMIGLLVGLIWLSKIPWFCSRPWRRAAALAVLFASASHEHIIF